jgi:hypothetical protein
LKLVRIVCSPGERSDPGDTPHFHAGYDDSPAIGHA